MCFQSNLQRYTQKQQLLNDFIMDLNFYATTCTYCCILFETVVNWLSICTFRSSWHHVYETKLLSLKSRRSLKILETFASKTKLWKWATHINKLSLHLNDILVNINKQKVLFNEKRHRLAFNLQTDCRESDFIGVNIAKSASMFTESYLYFARFGNHRLDLIDFHIIHWSATIAANISHLVPKLGIFLRRKSVIH